MAEDNNEHWRVINSGGRQVSNTPQQLWEAAITYFKWCDDNPIKAKRTLTSGKTQGDKVIVEFKRPYSIEGMCLHCGLSKRYINDITQSMSKDSEWYMVLEKILMIIYTQNLEGAIVDLYNPIMVSKVLNLENGKDESEQPVKIEITHSQSSELANSENDILKKLDFQKVEILKSKEENVRE